MVLHHVADLPTRNNGAIIASLFEKCDAFWARMRKTAGEDFDRLRGTFARTFPITNCTPHIEMNGRRYLQVATNDYLGLVTHPEVIEAAAKVVAEHGAGTPLGARLLTGTTELHLALERRLAQGQRALCEAWATWEGLRPS